MSWTDMGCVLVGSRARWAVTDKDDRYRYLLGRDWSDPPHAAWPWEQDVARVDLLVFCMLNPSTARVTDDQTVRKCVGFAKTRGCSAILVCNLFGMSATDPYEMVGAAADGRDVVGPHNAVAVALALRSSVLPPVAAWGHIPDRVRLRAQPFVRIVRGYLPLCLGKNKDGSPRHPLRLPYDTAFVPYARPA